MPLNPYRATPFGLLTGPVPAPSPVVSGQTHTGLRFRIPASGARNPRQEAEWRCCAGGREAGRRARNEGTGTSLRDGPEAAPEGGSQRSPDPDVGACFLLLTFLCTSKERQNPGGRNQRPRGSQEVGQTSKAHASTLSTASTNTRGDANSISREAISTATCTLLPRVIRSPVATSVIR